MSDDDNRQCVLAFIGAYYSGDAAAALACCTEDFDTITYAPVDLFPHLGHKHGKAWVQFCVTQGEETLILSRSAYVDVK